jgi:hypothetical protein
MPVSFSFVYEKGDVSAGPLPHPFILLGFHDGIKNIPMKGMKSGHERSPCPCNTGDKTKIYLNVPVVTVSCLPSNLTGGISHWFQEHCTSFLSHFRLLKILQIFPLDEIESEF